MILYFLGFNPTKQGRNSQQGSFGLQDINACIRIVVYGEWQPDWEETCIWLMGKSYGLIRIPFVQPFIRACYIYPIQRSLWYKKNFAWPASCSRLQPVFVGSCFKNNVHKRAIHRRNLLIKKFIQPKSINQHQPTKINQHQSTNVSQPKSTNPCFFTGSNRQSPPPTSWTQPLPTWNGTTLETSQKATDVEVRHASQDHPSTLPETNSKSTWKWMLGRVVSLWDGPIFRCYCMVSFSWDFLKDFMFSVRTWKYVETHKERIVFQHQFSGADCWF